MCNIILYFHMINLSHFNQSCHSNAYKIYLMKNYWNLTRLMGNPIRLSTELSTIYISWIYEAVINKESWISKLNFSFFPCHLTSQQKCHYWHATTSWKEKRKEKSFSKILSNNYLTRWDISIKKLLPLLWAWQWANKLIHTLYPSLIHRLLMGISVITILWLNCERYKFLAKLVNLLNYITWWTAILAQLSPLLSSLVFLFGAMWTI